MLPFLLAAGLGADHLFNQGRAAKGAGDAVGRAGTWAFGGDNKTGAFGTGQFQPQGYEVDPNASQIPGLDAWMAQLQAGAAGAGGRAAPGINMGPQDQMRAGQMDLIQMLMAQARGEGPSVAQAQLQAASDRNMAQAMALGAAQAGGTRGAGALRGIAQQRSAIGQQMSQDSALLRLQEQMAARSMLGGVLGQARGQDIGLAVDQARVQLQQQQMNDDLVRFYTSQGLDLAKAQQAANMDMQRLRTQQNLGLEGLRHEGFESAAGRRKDWMEKLLNALSRTAGSAAQGGGVQNPSPGMGGQPAGSGPPPVGGA